MNDIVYIDHMKIADVPANEQSTHHFWLCKDDVESHHVMACAAGKMLHKTGLRMLQIECKHPSLVFVIEPV